MKKITKILSALVLVVACFAGIMTFAGCDNSNKVLNSIGLDKSIKTTYCLNEELDFQGAKLVLFYEDDTASLITLSQSMVTGFHTLTVGTRELTITYKEKTTKVEYTVSEDTAALLNTVSQNLLNAQKVKATMQGGVGYDEMQRDGNNFKFKDSNGSVYVCTYPFKTTDTNPDIWKDKKTEEIVGQYLGSDLLAGLATSNSVSVEFKNQKYVITILNYNYMGTAYDYELVVSADKNIEKLTQKNNSTSGVETTTINYFYTNLPEIVWPNE